MVWLNAIITLVVYKNSLKMNELLIISFELCMLIVWARLWLHQFPRNWIGLHGWIKLNSIECSTVSVCIHFYHFLPVFLLFWCYFCSFFLKILWCLWSHRFWPIRINRYNDDDEFQWRGHFFLSFFFWLSITIDNIYSK